MKARGIVLNDRKMVYWYLPKTACTTLKNYFAVELGLTIPFRDGTAMDIHGQDIGFEFTEQVIPEYYNWAYVRNPYDRISSLYSQKIVTEKVDRKVFPDGNKFYSYMSFEKFVKEIISIENPERHYILQSKLLPNGVHFHKLEGDLFLKMIKPKNTSRELFVYDDVTKELVYKHYEQDFIRFGYNK